jgi:DNA-binding NarL/FixJ family response regulator
MTATTVVAYVPDLMDRSKVSAAALDRVTFSRRAEDLPSDASSAGATLVVIDLSRPGALDAIGAVAALDPRPAILGFGSHVDRDLLAAARDAGCDRVLARSAFFADIAAHLA